MSSKSSLINRVQSNIDADVTVTTDDSISIIPLYPIDESGIIELVGVNDQVDQNDYGDTAVLAFGGDVSGEILMATLVSTEDGTGSIQIPECQVFVFDTNPSTTAGDTTIGAAYWPTCIGIIDIVPGDWSGDANGKVANTKDQPVAFHEVSNLYFVFKNLDANGINDAAGDDEQIEINMWYRRDS